MPGKRILVVWEHNPELLDFCKITLENCGFRVDTKDDISLALQDFQAEKYVLVILDLRIKSRELFRKMKAIDSKIKSCHLDVIWWDIECLKNMQVDLRTVLKMPMRFPEFEQKLNEILLIT